MTAAICSPTNALWRPTTVRGYYNSTSEASSDYMAPPSSLHGSSKRRSGRSVKGYQGRYRSRFGAKVTPHM